MVMFSSAICSTKDYLIILAKVHDKAIHITEHGKVSAADISIAQNITIGSTGVLGIFKITLYSKEVGRYLCFNKQWKLIGRKTLGDYCYFTESLHEGYYEFRSTLNMSRRIGFTRHLRPIGHQSKNLKGAYFHFNKLNAENFSRSTIAENRIRYTKHKHALKKNCKRCNKNNNSKFIQRKFPKGSNNTLSNIIARERQHKHEQKIRHHRKYIQSQNIILSQTKLPAKSSSTLLAPSMLNFFATLAATHGRRKFGLEKKEDEGDVENTKKQAKDNTSQSTKSSTIYLLPKKVEHGHNHHIDNGDQNQEELIGSSKNVNQNSPADINITFLKEYSNSNSSANITSNINYFAILALPKNVLDSNRMTEYNYSSSIDTNNNKSFNQKKNNDADSRHATMRSVRSIEKHKINTVLENDNNLRDYIIPTKIIGNANRINVTNKMKEHSNKIKSIVQYKYVSFIFFLWFFKVYIRN